MISNDFKKISISKGFILLMLEDVNDISRLNMKFTNNFLNRF